MKRHAVSWHSTLMFVLSVWHVWLDMMPCSSCLWLSLNVCMCVMMSRTMLTILFRSAMPCHALLYNALQCSAVQCRAVPCRAVLCCAVLRGVMLCYTAQRYAMRYAICDMRDARLSYGATCCAMLRYYILCYDMLWYDIM